ncbi:MAG: sulfocyanin-like copper-binding protein [Gemmatimonadota bacterium]|jgi:sulfocyanin
MKSSPLLSVAILVTLTACGGGESSSDQMQESQPAAEPAQPAAQPAQAPDASSAPMTQPDWYQYDKSANTVEMTITAGLTDAMNHWNYNGATNGSMIITVPEGAQVSLTLKNDDPAMAHSLGIVDKVGGYSATPTAAPVFDGAVTTPHTATEGVNPGESQTIHFTASKAGKYAAVCYMAGHATTGMWIHFNVSADGEAGVQTAGS